MAPHMSNCKRPGTPIPEDLDANKRFRNDDDNNHIDASTNSETTSPLSNSSDGGSSHPSPTSTTPSSACLDPSSSHDHVLSSDRRPPMVGDLRLLTPVTTASSTATNAADVAPIPTCPVATAAPTSLASGESLPSREGPSLSLEETVRLSLSPFRPSEASSPSTTPATPQRNIKAEPEQEERATWIPPAAWRPVGRYVRVRNAPLLVQGAHGEVTRVIDVLKGQVLARKRINFLHTPSGRLLFEIEALTRLAGHKGVTELIDVCYTTHKVDIIMPLYWGSLQDLFDQAHGRGLVTSLAKNLTLQLLVAVSFIHRKEIIHLDIKPSNIMLTQGFVIKVGDFGIAALAGQEGDTRTYGTLGYTAPECFLGSARPTFQVDVWSTGCVVADLFLGHQLFAASHDPASSMEDILAFTGHPGVSVFARARFPPSIFELPMDWRPFESDASERLQDANEDAAELVVSMLCLHPNRRPHLATFYKHHLFTNAPLPNQTNPSLPRREMFAR
ncbi:hypothetical protein CF327_g7548 [Tilletia walkeri]|nr:hypothetical protein CF327_g7548 [Tilletia walkeri]